MIKIISDVCMLSTLDAEKLLRKRGYERVKKTKSSHKIWKRDESTTLIFSHRRELCDDAIKELSIVFEIDIEDLKDSKRFKRVLKE